MTFKDYVYALYEVPKLNDRTKAEIDILSACVEKQDKENTDLMLQAIGHPRNIQYKRMLSNYQSIVQGETEIGMRKSKNKHLVTQ